MKILVIEDDVKMSRTLVAGLRAEQYHIDCAFDGLDGFDKARQPPYAAIILELTLPRLEGTELISRLRANHVNTPILVLTEQGSVESKVASFEAGADDYVVKPFNFSELIVRLRALLRRPIVNHSNVLRIGDLEIDQLSRQVRVCGKRIKLTSKEYALLDFLAVNSGRILSRAMIVETVWDQSFEGLSNIVDVYVRLLRAKVDEPFGKRHIRTVRNMGYVLSDGEDEP